MTEKLEGTDFFEQYADLYIQRWLVKNEKLVDEIIQLKDKKYTTEEVREYINMHPIEEDLTEEEFETLFSNLFDVKNPSPNKEDEKIDHKERRLLSEEEALEQMNTDLNKVVDEKMKELAYPHEYEERIRKDIIETIHIKSNPEDIGLKKGLIKSILKGNMDFISETTQGDEKDTYDFEINSEQIIICGTANYFPIVYIYIPDKKYPEGMLLSNFLEQQKIQKHLDELRKLYLECVKDGVDWDSLNNKLDQEIQEDQMKG